MKEKYPALFAALQVEEMQMQEGGAFMNEELLATLNAAFEDKDKEKADALRESLSQLHGEDRKQAKEEARQERRKYTRVKRARWALLKNHDTLRDSQATNLTEILDAHSDLAICYAMKEEMCGLFNLRDVIVAGSAWKKWFAAAKESGIPALVRFAELKEKRIDGLIAHAIYPISTGKLEGFNNKIKVAKRLAYGYRDNHFFFTLVRFLSVPFPNFP